MGLVLACCLLLGGCTLRLAYHFLDWGLQWKLQHYLALNAEQRTFAKAAISRFHHWHQRHELPRYVIFLERTKARVQLGGGFSAAELRQLSDHVEDFLDDAIHQLEPDLTQLLMTLSDQQVAELDATLAEDRRDYYKRNVKPDAAILQERLAKDLTDVLGNYVGKLTREQAGWVHDWSRQLRPFGELVNAQQRIWANQVAAALRRREQQALLLAKVQELLMYRSERWEPNAREVIKANEQLILEVLARIANSLTNKQRQAAIDKIDTYLDDCRQLIATAED